MANVKAVTHMSEISDFDPVYGRKGKLFDFREDRYIVSYFDVADVATDLGRSEASIKARVKKLKACGAWGAMERIEQAQRDYLACLGYDEVDQAIATLARY